MNKSILASTEKNIVELIKESLTKATPYKEYRELVKKLASEGKSTGPNQTEALTNYTKLNYRRMKRFDKTVKIDSDTASQISSIKRQMTFLVLTESWCGDAAPAMPVMNKIADLNENLDFKIALRDENLELMNRFLYNGTLSIPRLILIDDETGSVLGDWGPRPSTAQKMAEDYKKEHGKLSAEFKEDLQIWYNKDKGQTTLKDLTRLLLENIGNGSLL